MHRFAFLFVALAIVTVVIACRVDPLHPIKAPHGLGGDDAEPATPHLDGRPSRTLPEAPPPPPPTDDGVQIVTPFLPQLDVAEDDALTLEAVGGVAPYTWSLEGDDVPGLTLDASSGALLGAVATSG